MLRKNLIPALCVIAVIIIVFIVMVNRSPAKKDGTAPQPEASSAETAAVSNDTDPDTAQGLSYLRSLEAKNPEDVDAALKAIRLQELVSLRDERMRQMESGEISVWSLFEDYVIMGDSRVAGFTFLGVLDDSRILAAYGDTTRAIAEHYEDLENLNPSYIFLAYGLNDMVQNGCETPEAFAQVYKERLADLQAHFPDAKLFVNPIFPCTGEAFERWEKWRETEPYSEAIRDMVKSEGYYYVSNDNITDFKSYWQDDGIHFNAPFYTLWSQNMIMAMYDSELGLEESEGSYQFAEDEAPEE